MKICAHCGAELSRKAYEKPYQFLIRATCGRSCAQRIRRKDSLAPSTRYRRYKVDGKNKQLSRHLVEQSIGRPLLRSELVHHTNENKLDDRLDNYEIVTAAEHNRHHKQKHPFTKTCVTCGDVFTPHPTKRARAQTCGKPVCKSSLLKLRARQRRAVPDPRSVPK